MRVAHASDLHLLDVRGVPLRRFLNKRLTGGANLLLHRGGHYKVELFRAILADWRREGFLHCVATGDLSNLSLEAEFALARRLLDDESPGPEYVSVIPGNHDVYTRGAQRARRFENAFAPYLTSDLDVAPTGAAFPFVRLRGPLAIVGLSSGVATAPVFASGTLGHAQLQALERALTHPALADKFRLVLVHHPPAPPYSRHPLRGLRDAQALLEVLARVGCELVLHGHEHVPLEHWIDGPAGSRIRVVGGASATHYDGVPAHAGRYNVYHLAERAGARPVLDAIEIRAYDDTAGAFIAGVGPSARTATAA